MMNCDDIKNVLAHFLSGELNKAQSDEIRGHLISCVDCQKELDAYKEVWKLLDVCKDEEPDPGYIERFWKRMALRKPWWQRVWDKALPVMVHQRLASALIILVVVVVTGALSMRMINNQQTEKILTALSAEEIELVKNLDMIENLDLLEQMDMLEGLMDTNDLTLKSQGMRHV